MNFVCRNGHLWTGAFLLVSLGLALTSSCTNNQNPPAISSAKGTPEEAEKFIADAEERLFDLNLKFSRADWIKSTFITEDTEALSASANEELIAATTELAEQSRLADAGLADDLDHLASTGGGRREAARQEGELFAPTDHRAARAAPQAVDPVQTCLGA